MNELSHRLHVFIVSAIVVGTLFAVIVGAEILHSQLVFGNTVSYTACMEKRRTAYLNGESEWFDTLLVAEHMPMMSPMREKIRVAAFEKRHISLEAMKVYQCSL